MTEIIGRTTGFAPPDPGVIFDPTHTGALDDASILFMLQSRMDDLDSQIGDLTRTLERRTAEAQRIGGEIERFQVIRELLSHEPQMDPSSGQLRLDQEIGVDELMAAAERLGLPRDGLFAADANVEGGVTVKELLAHVQINGSPLTGITSRETIQVRGENLSETLRQANSGNEQTMVRLQSVMQQRTQAVTLATNMLKAVDEARDAVVGNLR